MGAVHFSAKNFDSEVLKSDVPVLVDFYAEWCGPCKMLAPIIDEVADELAGKVKVGKMNVDEAQEIAARYNIMSIPNMIVFKNGEVADQMVGAMPKQQIIEKIKARL